TAAWLKRFCSPASTLTTSRSPMIRDVFSPEEARQASASELVRRWDHALIYGSLVGVAVIAGCLWISWQLGTPPKMGRWDAVVHGLQSLNYMLTQHDFDWLPWGELKQDAGALWRLVLSFTLGAGAGWWTGAQAAKPMS